MTSLLIKPFKIFLKPILGIFTAKSVLTEVSKLPGNYRMALHKGLAHNYKGLNVPTEILSIILEHKGFEMDLALEEKNGQWRYKSAYFVEGLPIGGKEYTFKVREKFNLEENGSRHSGKAKEISVESLEDSLVLEGQDETITLAPLPKHYGKGILMEVEGDSIPSHKVYFEKASKALEWQKAGEKDPGNNKEFAEDTSSSDKCPFF